MPQALSRGLAPIAVVGSLLTILGLCVCLLAPEMSGPGVPSPVARDHPNQALSLPTEPTLLPLVLSPEWMGGSWQSVSRGQRTELSE